MSERDPASGASASISAVVVAFNSGVWLKHCAQALLASAQVAELIIVDNASSDGSADSVSALAKVQILRNAVNLGFAAGCNRGAAQSQQAWLLFVNPDCVVAPDQLSALLQIAASEPRVGVVSAQLLNADGSAQRASLRNEPTPARAIAQALGLSAWSTRVQGVEMRVPKAEGLHEVAACSGALMLMRRSLYQQLGGFDEGYFLHCEDLDLCHRVRAAGFRVLVDTRVRVPHAKGTSSQQNAALVRRAKYHGMLRYFGKFHASSTPAWLRLLARAGLWLRFRLARG